MPVVHHIKESNDTILTIEEVAAFLKITERTVYRLLTKREIPAFKVGGSWRFKKSYIEDWIFANSAMYFSAKKKEGNQK